MNKVVLRLWVLLLLMGGGLSLVWFLPQQQEIQPSLLQKDLPHEFGNWTSQKGVVSQAELTVLASDTEFVRRRYRTSQRTGFSGVEVSFVYSGRDLNNSIHRPERCLRTQGWNFVRERSIIISDALGEGVGLPVREILCVRPRVKSNGVEPPKNNKGEPLYDMRLQYYTFFGAEDIVSGHYERTFADMRGRLLGGFDQQWAYATFSVPVTSVYREQGFEIADDLYFDEIQSTEIMQGFMRELLPKVVATP